MYLLNISGTIVTTSGLGRSHQRWNSAHHIYVREYVSTQKRLGTITQSQLKYHMDHLVILVQLP